GMADVIYRALHMPLEERQRRHSALLANIRTFDVHWWRESFLKALAQADTDTDGQARLKLLTT
ncbi:MAG: alpha,alpha-trehalose-phosphate synthase, partial [Giesbergeria sp.]